VLKNQQKIKGGCSQPHAKNAVQSVMRNGLPAAVVALAAAGCALAQTGQPEFEAVSVKVAEPVPVTADGQRGIRVGTTGGPGTSDPGPYTSSGTTLKNLIIRAYGVRNYQIAGPDWLAAERFDVAAKLSPDTTKEQFALMLQKLLSDRFGVAVHRESREMPVYALVIGKNGLKLKEAQYSDSKSAGPKGVWLGGGQIGGRVATMASLADALGAQLSRPVQDQTGLQGTYDFSLSFDPQDMAISLDMPVASSRASVAADPVAPSLFTAIQDQLGLKLEGRKGPVEVLVVDRALKVPTGN
jgi:uncharacterized protein (TIGR03435 family)